METPGKYTDHICVDISYINKNGQSVHSDLCYDKTSLSLKHRELIHQALDEWINLANGTGAFTVQHIEN